LNLQHIVIYNFRNHSSTSINCSPGINLFLGNNGEGKTNILESISYLCLAKSFYASSDSIVTKIGENGFAVTGLLLSDSGVEYEIRINFDRILNQKTVTVNKSRIDKASTLIGRFPAVILSPEKNAITLGSPADRRKFIDFVLSQSNRKYLDSLIEYRRVLKQRNKMINDIQITRNEKKEEIEPWNYSLIKNGSIIMKKRKEFIEDFYKIIYDSYRQISGTAENPKIIYSPSVESVGNNNDTIEETFRTAIESQYLEELRLGYTILGPHRDDFIFRINDLDVKNFASQGQHKTFLVALKLAEFYYLKSQCNENPILLLDDVLSELDKKRCHKLIRAAADTGQVFITSTNENALDGLPAVSAKLRKFFIKDGRIERVEDSAKIN